MAKIMIKRYALYFIIAFIPLPVSAQNPTLESCGLKLYETTKNVYKTDPSIKIGLKTLSGTSLAKTRSAQREWSDCVRGKKIPDLNFTTINGKRYSNSDLRGKILVINFWFKNCAPCIVEMPSLNQLFNEFKNKNVLFIGFATDNEKALKPDYLNSGKFLFDVVPNSKDIGEKFFFGGYPTTYIVDQNGRIVKAWSGMADANEIAKPIINQLLAHQAK